jgi:hypothetical protein
MKKCVYCGLENADDAVICATCRTEFVPSSNPTPGALENDYLISPDEWRYWNRMTLRQFAVLLVRLAALWCILQAVLESTLLVRYMLELPYLMSSQTRYFYSPAVDLFLVPIFRIGLWGVAGLVLFFRGERVLSWMVRGAVLRQPPETSPSKSAPTPSTPRTLD